MTDISKAAVERMCHAAPFADNEAGIPEMVETLRALSARVEELSAALQPEMAELLFNMGAHRCQLTADETYGWPDGLRVPMNYPPQSDDDWMAVAHLDIEDSQFGPRLWGYAISVLKALEALKGKSND